MGATEGHEGGEASGRPPAEPLGEWTYQPEREMSIRGAGQEPPWLKTEDTETTTWTSGGTGWNPSADA